MSTIESAWAAHPGYAIERVPFGQRVRVWHGDLLLVDTDGAVRLTETEHLDRVYVPRGDVRWEHFTATDLRTVCPFKGEAIYWTLSASAPPLENVLWQYREPFDEVAGIDSYVGVYHEQLRVEQDEPWPGDSPGQHRTRGFPAWGTAAELQILMDAVPTEAEETGSNGTNHFVAPARPIFVPKWGPTSGARNVVEGGQLLGQAIVAAGKAVPGQRVTNASMIFSRAASFDDPIDIEVDPQRLGRTFSNLHVRMLQNDKLCSSGTLMLYGGAGDVIRHGAEMPSVAAPADSPRLEMGVIGRELRVVDGAYTLGPEQVGPPRISVWCRFAEAPESPVMRQALMAQSMTHWTIAAAMRPHAGVGERDAHVTLSTGIMAISVSFFDDPAELDLTDWLLYDNVSPYAGAGLAYGDGKVFTQAGRLIAAYSVQAMIRAFEQDPAELGHDATTAM